MIIRQVKLHNFGIYSSDPERGGPLAFDLQPVPAGNFHRPIVLFRGKNGVGKTTFVEAIRLCLHGSLVVGSRVGQQEFDTYLMRRIHRRQGDESPDSASVEVIFDYVTLGRKRLVRVRREWQVAEGRLTKSVTLWEDGGQRQDLDAEQIDQYLRELIPPGILDLFFFDGEKVQTLAENNEAGSILLADTIRALLGLDLVDQLGQDLDIYIARQESHGEVKNLQSELENLTAQIQGVQDAFGVNRRRVTEVEAQIATLHTQIEIQTQQLANQGGHYAHRRQALQDQTDRLKIEIEVQRRQVQNLCGDLMPFAIVPELLSEVSAQLEIERQHKQAQAVRQAVSENMESLRERFVGDDYWATIGINPNPVERNILYEKMVSDLQEVIAGPALPSQDLLLDVSEQERLTLLRWIDAATGDVPVTFAAAVDRLNELERTLERTREDLARAPEKISIQPIVEELAQLNRQLGGKQRELDAFREESARLERQLAQLDAQRNRVRLQISEHEAETSRLYMATRTQELLTAYREQLAQRKVGDVATLLQQRFNQLCRKESFLDQVEIDPHHFTVTLYRMGKPFERRQLSAGENQLFAVATLWALRQVSRRPMPVVIDTPLSRLDSEHRLSMLREFFPHAGHQVIILATDAEVDEAQYEVLQPVISHVYEMNYDTVQNTMRYQRNDNGAAPPV